jgi:hypothetical protein
MKKRGLILLVGVFVVMFIVAAIDDSRARQRAVGGYMVGAVQGGAKMATEYWRNPAGECWTETRNITVNPVQQYGPVQGRENEFTWCEATLR